jgi:hypothetical protein
MSVELLTFEMFSDKIDQAFLLDEPGAPPIAFKLIEATLLPNFAKAARYGRSGCTSCATMRSAV